MYGFIKTTFVFGAYSLTEFFIFRKRVMKRKEKKVDDTVASDISTEVENTEITAEEKPKKLSEMKFSECKSGGQRFAWLMNYIFIDGMSGMALGLFATLIAGTIVWQIGNLCNKGGANWFGLMLEAIGKVAQITMGAGIGAGICLKMKKTKPLVVVSACAAGMIGSYAKVIIQAVGGVLPEVYAEKGFSLLITSPGDPMGAFIGSMVAMVMSNLVSGRTKVDIIVTPLVGIICGSIAGIGLGYPVSLALTQLGVFIGWIANLSIAAAILTGAVIAGIMGVCLTLPISSAAIGVSIGLSGIAAGAAVVGCCCQMVGFAVMSFRENKWGGLIAQGVGTSMLQIPNIFRKPLLFVPPIISSVILGAVSVLLPNGTPSLGLFATPAGSGMGTAGLVGPIDMIFEMIGTKGCNAGLTLLWVALFCIVLPGALTFGISELFRKLGWIKYGDLKLEL